VNGRSPDQLMRSTLRRFSVTIRAGGSGSFVNQAIRMSLRGFSWAERSKATFGTFDMTSPMT